MSFHSLRVAGAATLVFAVPVFALGQPTFAAAPTPTHPLSQPTLEAPSVASRSGPLPSGSYRLSIDMPADEHAAARSATDTVTLTHSGSVLALSIGGGQSFSGVIDASGALAITLAESAVTLHLNGTASGPRASGQAFVAGAVPPAPQGTFELVPPGTPLTRARPSGFVEAVNALLHAIGCWARSGAGC